MTLTQIVDFYFVHAYSLSLAHVFHFDFMFAYFWLVLTSMFVVLLSCYLCLIVFGVNSCTLCMHAAFGETSFLEKKGGVTEAGFKSGGGITASE